MRTIFIDFGNVIAFFDHQRAVAKLARYTDLKPHELTLALYGGVIEEDYECGRIGTSEYIHLATRDGRLSCSAEEFEAAFVDIFTPNPEVCDLIPRLKKHHRLVLASNTNDAHYRKYCDQFADVLKHFDERCPSHLVGHRKPHREYFEHCQKYANAAPHECLFLDDYPSNIEAAKAFGWNCVSYRPDESLADRLRDMGVIL
jgi:HAD superfamily hydrolase (TIGR01509 family)